MKEKKNLNLEKKIQIINQRDTSIKSALQNQIQKNKKSKIQKIEKKKEKKFNEREQYKDIINKQKDIMIALSNKLNERDEMFRRTIRNFK